MKLLKKLMVLFFILLFGQNLLNAQTDDVITIKTEIKKWMEAFNRQDFTTALSIYSADFKGFYFGQPDQDLNVIKDQFQTFSKNKYLIVTCSCDILETQVSGEMAFVRLLRTYKFKPTAVPNAQEAREKELQIWQKQSDGSWKLTRSSIIPLGDPKSKAKQ